MYESISIQFYAQLTHAHLSTVCWPQIVHSIPFEIVCVAGAASSTFFQLDQMVNFSCFYYHMWLVSSARNKMLHILSLNPAQEEKPKGKDAI
jgi:hypothetical protein